MLGARDQNRRARTGSPISRAGSPASSAPSSRPRTGTGYRRRRGVGRKHPQPGGRRRMTLGGRERAGVLDSERGPDGLAPLHRHGLDLEPRGPVRGLAQLMTAQRDGRHARIAAQRARLAQVGELQLVEEIVPSVPFAFVLSQLTSCWALHAGAAAACALRARRRPTGRERPRRRLRQRLRDEPRARDATAWCVRHDDLPLVERCCRSGKSIVRSGLWPVRRADVRGVLSGRLRAGRRARPARADDRRPSREGRASGRCWRCASRPRRASPPIRGRRRRWCDPGRSARASRVRAP